MVPQPSPPSHAVLYTRSLFLHTADYHLSSSILFWDHQGGPLLDCTAGRRLWPTGCPKNRHHQHQSGSLQKVLARLTS